MKIGILGTGNLAVTLGRCWAGAGHSVVVTGRSPDRVKVTAEQIGSAATPVDPADLPALADVIVVAVAWDGLENALAIIGGPEGALSGTTVLDCTNPIDFTTGRMVPEKGSAAELVARLAVGAHVVKALHLFAGASWPFRGASQASPVVAICGDDAGALAQTEALIGDLGARVAVLGGLDSSRQAEEAAGFVMRVVAAGANPRFAIPDVDPALLRAQATQM